MTADDKLARLLDIIQVDPGNRGLGRIPGDNLFTACPGDFAAACHSIAGHLAPAVELVTGFVIPAVQPPAFETDGPLGAWFLARALQALGIPVNLRAELPVLRAVEMVPTLGFRPTHRIAVERSGPVAPGGEHFTMRGRPIAGLLDAELTALFTGPQSVTTIGIGDGGNEIGMGKIAADMVTANVPGGARVHCHVATDFLVVAGVSNWGAYALAAGVSILRGATWPDDWADADAHRAVLTEMVARGPLVDGVRGAFEPTVDGLDWGTYSGVLAEIGRVVNG